MTNAGPVLRPGPDPVRVVLVDDTPDIRLLVRVALENHGGFTVVGEAGDGLVGVQQVAALRPELVVLDLAMPVMDGMEALRRIRAEHPDIAVVMLSAFEAERMAGPTLAAGAAGYVQKGGSAKRIVAGICRAIGMDEAPTPRRLAPAPTPTGSLDSAKELDRIHTALASAAHELRGPAGVLLAMTELLSSERDSLDAGTFNRMLDAIARQAHVLDRVTGDLLTSTQSQRGVLTVAVEPLNLRDAIEGATVTMVDRVRAGVDCDPAIVVLADPTRVQQMLSNLLSNAVRYGAAPVSVLTRIVAPRPGTVDAQTAEVRVVDRGAGVADNFRDRLFAQFSRGEPERANGMGLGLYVVRSLAEAQGGRAWYEPAPGGGAAFCFSLPLAH